jgi:hypothetical protein
MVEPPVEAEVVAVSGEFLILKPTYGPRERVKLSDIYWEWPRRPKLRLVVPS